MRRIFSTSDVEPQHRFDHWHGVACEKLFNHDSTPDDRKTFQAELKQGTFGAIELIMFEHSPLKVIRALHHVAGKDSQHLFLCRQFAGSQRLDQAGRSALLESGDMVLLDPQLPYAGAFADRSRLLVLKVPRHLLRDRLGEIRDLVACPIRKVPGSAALMSGFLATLPNHAASLDETSCRLATDYFLGLLAHVFGIAGGIPGAGTAGE
jgi:AraC family transcriptional regulator, positive regulator of tynA and feaB